VGEGHGAVGICEEGLGGGVVPLVDLHGSSRGKKARGLSEDRGGMRKYGSRVTEGRGGRSDGGHRARRVLFVTPDGTDWMGTRIRGGG
jgi:hypothetical protein